MHAQDVIALVVVAGAVAFVGRAFWRTMTGGHGCGCSRGASCSRLAGPQPGGKTADTAVHTGAGLVRRPLVPMDQVGVPEVTPEHGSTSNGQMDNPGNHDG